MKRFLSSALLLMTMGVLIPAAKGEEAPTAETASTVAEEEIPVPTVVLNPKIVVPKAVQVGKKVIFDASTSEFPDEEGVRFFWDLGDGNTSQESTEIVHTYSEVGEKTVTFTLAFGEEKVLTKETIFVYDRKIILITSSSVLSDTSQIKELTDEAAANGVFLSIISVEEDESALIMEEKFIQLFQQERENIADTEVLIFWTPSSIGIQAFTRFWQNLEEDKRFPISDKTLIRITDRGMAVTAASLRQAFEVVHPKFFLLTRAEALHPIFEVKEFELLTETLGKRGIEWELIDENTGPHPFLLLTKLITEFLVQGIPASTIFLILSFPFIAFFVAFARQVIGLSTFGVYLPIMLALSFQILTLKFAIIILIVILVLSFFLRILFTKLDILYIPRAALMLSAIALSFLSVIWFALRFGIPVSISLAIFPMLVMSTISEKFLSAQSEEGLKGAIFGVFETILIAVLSFLLTNFSYAKEMLLSLPEIIIIPIVGIFLLGKFTGLRMSEYFRFRSLFREGMEEE